MKMLEIGLLQMPKEARIKVAKHIRSGKRYLSNGYIYSNSLECGTEYQHNGNYYDIPKPIEKIFDKVLYITIENDNMLFTGKDVLRAIDDEQSQTVQKV